MSTISAEERRLALESSVDRLRAAVAAANDAVNAAWHQVAEDVSDLQGVVVGPVDDAQAGRPRKLDPAVYDELVSAVVTTVQRQVRPGRTVLVVSRGDDRLLQIPGRRAQHFPQAPDGRYAGHHPADSSAALEHLEQLREAGAEYIVFPATASWWFDHYAGLSRHLDTRGWRIWGDQHCVIYRLPARRRRPSAHWSRSSRRSGQPAPERP